MSDEIHCPLCDYDLRGQLEPRCPECGYKFRWEDLRDPTLRLHPYLFEHHPERNIRSFIQTLIGGLRPRTFWSKLYPTQPSRPFRLLLYLALLSAFAILPTIADMAFTIVNVQAQRHQYRATLLAQLQSPRGRAWNTRYPPGTTPQQIVNQSVPPLTRDQLIAVAWEYGYARSITCTLLPLLMWPLLTLLTMMIFQWSMARARVRPFHVVRCGIYSADVAFWINLALTFGLIASAIARINGGAAISPEPGLITFVVIVVGWFIFAYRFATALRLYLQFDHPKSTVLATQIIVALAVAALIVNVKF